MILKLLDPINKVNNLALKYLHLNLGKNNIGYLGNTYLFDFISK